jgi:CBS domain-containing protein
MRVDVILRNKTNDVISISPDKRVQDAADLLAEKKIGALLVRDDSGAIRGVLSERDIVRGIANHKDRSLGEPVTTLMTKLVVTCTPADTLETIMQMMTERRVRHIPVIDEGRLIGIISIGDVVKHRISEIESESHALRQYITAG